MPDITLQQAMTKFQSSSWTMLAQVRLLAARTCFEATA
jgi:hypothetical protein